MSTSSDKYNAFPSDFPILTFPSNPLILGLLLSTAFGSTKVSPYIELNFLTISLHCSINGSWSSPTGISSASNAVISAA